MMNTCIYKHWWTNESPSKCGPCGEVARRQTVNYGKVFHGEGDNDILAHLRLCGCRKGHWCEILKQTHYWEVPLGKRHRKVREARKGGRFPRIHSEWVRCAQSDSVLSLKDSCTCQPFISGCLRDCRASSSSWAIGSSGEAGSGWWGWALQSRGNKWWKYVSVPVFHSVLCTIASLNQRCVCLSLGLWKLMLGASTLEKSLNKTFNLGVGLSGGESSLLVQAWTSLSTYILALFTWVYVIYIGLHRVLD